MLAHFSLDSTLRISYLLSTESGETFLKNRLILFFFSAEGETSNHAGASESQPSGEFCGDSKITFTYNSNLYLNYKRRDLSTFINMSCVQPSS